MHEASGSPTVSGTLSVGERVPILTKFVNAPYTHTTAESKNSDWRSQEGVSAADDDDE